MTCSSRPDASRSERASSSAITSRTIGFRCTWCGEIVSARRNYAKLSGRAVQVTDPGELAVALHALGAPPGQSSDLFRADIGEVVVTRVGEPPDHMVIELWRPNRPLHRIQRR